MRRELDGRCEWVASLGCAVGEAELGSGVRRSLVLTGSKTGEGRCRASVCIHSTGCLAEHVNSDSHDLAHDVSYGV